MTSKCRCFPPYHAEEVMLPTPTPTLLPFTLLLGWFIQIRAGELSKAKNVSGMLSVSAAWVAKGSGKKRRRWRGGGRRDQASPAPLTSFSDGFCNYWVPSTASGTHRPLLRANRVFLASSGSFTPRGRADHMSDPRVYPLHSQLSSYGSAGARGGLESQPV